MIAEIGYGQLKFLDDGDFVKAVFLRNYWFRIPKGELLKIGRFRLTGKGLAFSGVAQGSAERKLNFLVEKCFGSLTNSFTGKKTVYIHRNSGIPLTGNTAFGIVYRNTNVIEVKPVTGCNLDCVYCSIDEGAGSGKKNDFLIEKDYILDEIKKLADFIGGEWHCHIGTHGEPLIYPELEGLIEGISGIKNVKSISMDTNATILTEKKAEELINAGLTRFNISLDSLGEELAARMAGCAYSAERVKKLICAIGKKHDVLIAPVWVKGWNDAEIERIVKFALAHCPKSRIKLGIQNFLEYARGRRPAKQMPWKEFYGKLRELERKYSTKLVLSADDFGIRKAKALPKPFKKGQVVRAVVMCEGMYKGEKVCVSGGRSINVFGCGKKAGSFVNVKILRDKHNCFAGKAS
mgnify:CR=1 FL=1